MQIDDTFFNHNNWKSEKQYTRTAKSIPAVPKH